MKMTTREVVFLGLVLVLGAAWYSNVYFHWEPNLKQNAQLFREANKLNREKIDSIYYWSNLINRNLSDTVLVQKYVDSIKHAASFAWALRSLAEYKEILRKRDSIAALDSTSTPGGTGSTGTDPPPYVNQDSIAAVEALQKYLDSMRVVDSLKLAQTGQNQSAWVYPEWVVPAAQMPELEVYISADEQEVAQGAAISAPTDGAGKVTSGISQTGVTMNISADGIKEFDFSGSTTARIELGSPANLSFPPSDQPWTVLAVVGSKDMGTNVTVWSQNDYANGIGVNALYKGAGGVLYPEFYRQFWGSQPNLGVPVAGDGLWVTGEDSGANTTTVVRLNDTGSNSRSNTSTSYTNEPWVIGLQKNGAGWKDPNAGSIRAFMVFSKVLTPAEVMTILSQINAGARNLNKEWSLLDADEAISGMGQYNVVGSTLAASGSATLSVISGTANEYGLKSASTVSTDGWIEHDITLDKAIPGRTYKVALNYRLSSGDTRKIGGGIFSWGGTWPVDAPGTHAWYNEEWTYVEMFNRLYDTNGTIDFNLYSSYSGHGRIAGEGPEYYGLTIREVEPNLFVEPDDAVTNNNPLIPEVEIQNFSAGATISGVTFTTRGFDSADTANERTWYQKKSIRSNTTLAEFAGTGYVSMTTPAGALVIGERYKFSASIAKATGTTASFNLANWSGTYEKTNRPISLVETYEIVEIEFTADSPVVTARLDIDGTVYTSGWRIERVDSKRENLYGDRCGSLGYPYSTAQPPGNWSSANGGAFAVERSNPYRKGGTAIRVTGNASNSYIWTDDLFTGVAVGQKVRVTGKYYVETASAGQDILVYNSGATPSTAVVNMNQTYINRWVRFEFEYTRQNGNFFDLEITAGTGAVLVADLKIENMGYASFSDPITAVSPALYYHPTSIDATADVDNDAITVWNDLSGNNLNATVGAGTVTMNQGANRQVELGSGAWLDIPSNAALDFTAGTDEFTVVCRLGDVDWSGNGYIFSRAPNTSANLIGLGVTGGLLRYIYNGQTAFVDTGVNLQPNDLIVCVVKTTGLTIYCNGSVIVSETTGGNAGANGSTQSWNIGARTDGTYTPSVASTLDIFAIIPSALTTTQRQAIEAEFQIN